MFVITTVKSLQVEAHETGQRKVYKSLIMERMIGPRFLEKSSETFSCLVCRPNLVRGMG